MEEVTRTARRLRRSAVQLPSEHQTDYWTLSFFVFLLLTSYLVFFICVQFYYQNIANKDANDIIIPGYTPGSPQVQTLHEVDV